jgi:hypothetical protein
MLGEVVLLVRVDPHIFQGGRQGLQHNWKENISTQQKKSLSESIPHPTSTRCTLPLACTVLTWL